MTGTMKVSADEMVFRFDNGNTVHVRGNAVTLWGPGAVILWQSKTRTALAVALDRATHS